MCIKTGRSTSAYTPPVISKEPLVKKEEAVTHSSAHVASSAKVAENRHEGTMKTSLPAVEHEMKAELHGASTVHAENAEHAEGWFHKAMHTLDHEVAHPAHSLAAPLETGEKGAMFAAQKFGGKFLQVMEEAHHLAQGIKHVAPVLEGVGDLAAEELAQAAHASHAAEETSHIAKVVKLTPAVEEASNIAKVVKLSPVAEEASHVAKVIKLAPAAEEAIQVASKIAPAVEEAAQIAKLAPDVAHVAEGVGHVAKVGTGTKILAASMKGLNVLGGTVAAVSLGINVYKGVQAYQKGDNKELAREAFKGTLNAVMLGTAIAAPASGGTSLIVTAACVGLSYAADTKAFDYTYDAIASVPEKIDAAKTAVKEAATKTSAFVSKTADKAVDTAKATYKSAETTVKKTYAKAETAVKEVAAKTVTVAKETYKAVSSATVAAYSTAKQNVNHAVDTVKTGAKQAYNTVSSAVSSATTTASDYAASAYKSVTAHLPSMPSFSW